MKRKKVAVLFAVISVIYMGSYFCLRFSKLLVHQEVALVNHGDSGITREGPAICYFIHQDIGHGSYVDSDNYNKVNTPGIAVRIAKSFYYPLVKLELSYWENTRPSAIYETICNQ